MACHLTDERLLLEQSKDVFDDVLVPFLDVFWVHKLCKRDRADHGVELLHTTDQSFKVDVGGARIDLVWITLRLKLLLQDFLQGHNQLCQVSELVKDLEILKHADPTE